MTLSIIALTFIVIICILLPVVILGILIRKNKEEWKGIAGLFLSGAVVYSLMQWGIKEHVLSWLLNHTDFVDFINNQYVLYLLVIAFVGAVLTVLSQMFVVGGLFKKNLSFVKAIALAVGYSMAESVFLIGIKSINTIVDLVQEKDAELSTTTAELFLSGYERILLLVIEIAIVVLLVYFMEQNMSVRGGIIAICCYALVAFLPGFFIAFSLRDYYEVYSHSVALMLVYIVLTATAVTAGVIINAFKYQLKD